MSREITLGVLLVGLQLAVFRASQHLYTNLYFTTSGIFDRKEDVRLKAVLFRISIPTFAGASVPLLIDQHEYLVASLAGAIAWFLIIWPALWLPGLLPRAHRGLVLLLLLAFWGAFTGVPILGVEVTQAIRDVVSSDSFEWGPLIVGGLITLPLGLLPAALGRLASLRVTFPLDESIEMDAPEFTDDELLAMKEGEYPRSDFERVIDFIGVITRRGRAAFLILVLIVWVSRRVQRRD